MGSYYSPAGALTAHRSSPFTFASPNGVAGADGAAAALATIVIPANTLTKIGDRLRIYAYFQASGAGPITAALKLGPPGAEVTIGDLIVSNSALALIQCGVLYTAQRRAHVIEEEAGAVGASSGVNVQGFMWTSDSNLIFTQSQVVGQHLTLYSLIVDIFPGA